MPSTVSSLMHLGLNYSFNPLFVSLAKIVMYILNLNTSKSTPPNRTPLAAAVLLQRQGLSDGGDNLRQAW